MSSSNYISKVAIVGAGGNSGKFMTEALLKTGKHTVTALTRAESESKLPEGVFTKQIDYERPETLVEALRGQEALVITLSAFADKDVPDKLIKAAAEADVKWILPNEWAPDTSNEALVKDVFVFQSKPAARKLIKDLGKSSYIAVSTGFWYEWSLAIPPAFGFNFNKKTVTFYDDGETKISVSTWPQVGRAVAAILSLPVSPEHAGQEACLDQLKDKMVYVKSFTVSQKDMLDSVLRVTGDKKEDWSVVNEPSQDRFADGTQMMQQGNRIGMAKILYTRVMFPDGSGNTDNKGNINNLLGLKEDDIDQTTRVAIERAKEPSQWGKE